MANLCLIFGESLANGFWKTDMLANLWPMVFGELTRWRIFGESLPNLWRIFGEWLLEN